MSRLSDFLINDYAPHFGIVWNPATMNLKTEIPAAVRFEIEDKKPTIQQPAGHGVFCNTQTSFRCRNNRY